MLRQHLGIKKKVYQLGDVKIFKNHNSLRKKVLSMILRPQKCVFYSLFLPYNEHKNNLLFFVLIAGQKKWVKKTHFSLKSIARWQIYLQVFGLRVSFSSSNSDVFRNPGISVCQNIFFWIQYHPNNMSTFF